jgi:hypothetical protein
MSQRGHVIEFNAIIVLHWVIIFPKVVKAQNSPDFGVMKRHNGLVEGGLGCSDDLARVDHKHTICFETLRLSEVHTRPRA